MSNPVLIKLSPGEKVTGTFVNFTDKMGRPFTPMDLSSPRNGMLILQTPQFFAHVPYDVDSKDASYKKFSEDLLSYFEAQQEPERTGKMFVIGRSATGAMQLQQK